jgi:hypothetical protein
MVGDSDEDAALVSRDSDAGQADRFSEGILGPKVEFRALVPGELAPPGAVRIQRDVL